MHADCDGTHLATAVKNVTALCVDSDAELLAEADIGPLLNGLGNLSYLFQWRAGKFHLVLPFSAPAAGHDLFARRKAALSWLSRQWNRPLDMTAASPSAFLHPYLKRAPDELVISLWTDTGLGLDLDTLLGRLDYSAVPDRGKRPSTDRQKTAYGTAVHAALDIEGLLWPDTEREGKQSIRCPFHRDESKGPGDTSSIVWNSGRIQCSHNRCLGRTQAEFLSGLPGLGGDIAGAVRLDLEAARVSKVSVEEAGRRMRLALLSTRPHLRTATAVRVTTGAGKTRTVAQFLDDYCAPRWDAETGDVLPGRSAFYAAPTNALLREVRERITIPHRFATGVLAVLNDDGSRACAKWSVASRLQRAGGDVHRLMCSGCEFRVGCPARERSRDGEGSLTLTNHALLPSLVREAAEAGRVPLIVWDESPAFVESTRLRFAELDWMLSRFELEDTPRPATLDRIGEVVLFPDRYRVAMRPMVEVLRRCRGVGLEEAVADYGKTRLCESQLHRAEAMLGIPPSGDPWDRIRAVTVAARRVNVSEQTFDRMSEANQELVLRAEAIDRAVRSLLEPGMRTWSQPGSLEVAALTDSGRLWRDFGGVVLDATAPIHDLRALRADCIVEDIAVDDASDGTVRIFSHVPGLGRRNLAEHPDRRLVAFGAVAGAIWRHLRLLEKRLGRVPRLLLVTYSPWVEEWRGLLPGADVAYFGNTRGYDRWFREGFDAFVTVGDPYSNIIAEDRAYDVLGVQGVTLDEYCAYRAQAESAQAHGRARSPQQRVAGSGVRLALHFGRLAPLGWDSDNTVVEVTV